MKTISGINGGGQILRSALTLSMITGQAFRMNHIRAKRRKPGLMRQHLTCVKAAATICHAQIEGAEIGSTELTFTPGEITPGDYHFAIGSAGSTSLLAQTLMPALWHAQTHSTLTLEGGTHNPLAPPQPFLDQVTLATLRSIGIDVHCQLDEYGFAPAGGGKIVVEISPATQVKPLQLLDRGALQSLEIEVIARNVEWSIAERIIATASAPFPNANIIRTHLNQGPGQGICCLIRAQFEHGTEIVSSFGEIGTSAESVAKRAANGMKHFLSSGAAVNHHLADQLLLPLALHQGGSFLTLHPDEHFLTNQQTIQAFLPDVHFHIETKENSPLHEITIHHSLGQ
jgi:RNA 3'-terminal phosphate cyclase (ATP)